MELFLEEVSLPDYVFNYQYSEFIFLDMTMILGEESEIFYEYFSKGLKENNEDKFYMWAIGLDDLSPHMFSLDKISNNDWIIYESYKLSALEIYHSSSRNPVLFGETKSWAIYFDVFFGVGIMGLSKGRASHFSLLKENVDRFGWKDFDEYWDWFKSVAFNHRDNGNYIKKNIERLFRQNYTK